MNTTIDFQRLAERCNITKEELIRQSEKLGLLTPNGELTEQGFKVLIPDTSYERYNLRKPNMLRLIMVWQLTKASATYSDLYCRQSSIGRNQSYQDAEKTASLIEFITGKSVEPSSLITDDNTLSDECITLNEDLKKTIHQFEFEDSMRIGCTMPFVKDIEHSPNGNLIRATSTIYSYLFEDLSSWAFNLITQEELQNRIKLFKSSSFSFSIKKRRIVKTFQLVEKIYYEIQLKRILRKLNTSTNA